MAIATTERLEHIELKRLVPTPENPRVISESDPKTLSLVESVKANGVRVPVLCRPHPEQAGKFDLRAGHRRLVAARLAGLKTIPAVIREMNDDEALTETLIENMDRENLTPIEEARGIATMRGHGWTIQQIAEQLGKSPQTIARRANLLNLTENWQKVMSEDEEAETWPIASWELIARLPAEVQDRLLENSTYELADWGRKPRELERVLDEYRHLLKSATWALDDAELVASAGACTACPKRSSCQPDLFDDRQEDTCLDSECWASKAAAVIQRKVDELRAQHPEAVVVQRGGLYEPELRAFNPVNEWETTKVKKGEEGAVPALLIGGGKQPSVTWVKVRSNGSGGAAQPGQKKTLAQRMAALEKRRRKHVIAAVKATLADCARGHIDARQTFPNKGFLPFLRLAAMYGLFGDCMDDIAITAEADSIEYILSKHALESVLRLMPEWDAEGNWRRSQAVCQCLGIDIEALMAQAEAEIPTPKSILQEQEQAKIEAKKKPAKKAGKKRDPTPAEVERGYDIVGKRIAYASDGKAMEITPRAKKAGKGRNS